MTQVDCACEFSRSAFSNKMRGDHESRIDVVRNPKQAICLTAPTVGWVRDILERPDARVADNEDVAKGGGVLDLGADCDHPLGQRCDLGLPSSVAVSLA